MVTWNKIKKAFKINKIYCSHNFNISSFFVIMVKSVKTDFTDLSVGYGGYIYAYSLKKSFVKQKIRYAS